MSAQYLIVLRFIFIRHQRQTAEEDRHFSPNAFPKQILEIEWIALTATKHTIAFESKFIFIHNGHRKYILFLDSLGRWVSRVGYPIAPNVHSIVADIHGRPHTKLYFISLSASFWALREWNYISHLCRARAQEKWKTTKNVPNDMYFGNEMCGSGVTTVRKIWKYTLAEREHWALLENWRMKNKP